MATTRDPFDNPPLVRKTSRIRQGSFEASAIHAKSPPLTKKELYSWYSYDWANSVYSAVVISFFAPVLLNTLAEEHVHSAYDDCDGGTVWDDNQGDFNFSKQQSDCTTSCLTCKRGDGTQLWNCATGSLGDMPDAKIDFMGLSVSPFSFTTTVISLSVAIQAVLFIICGPWGDFGNNRKRLFMITSTLGCCSTMLLVFIWDEKLYWLAGILVIVSNSFFGLSIVYYNAFLPMLVDADPRVRALNTIDSADELHLRENIENNFSTMGFMAGYAGSLLLLVLTVMISMALGDDGTLAQRVCIFIAGLWWLGFSFFSFAFLEARPGPPLEDGEQWYERGRAKWACRGVVAIGRALWSAREMPNTLVFLALYFVYSDGYGTIGSIGVLYATENMCMSGSNLGLMMLCVTVAALFGGYGFLWVQQRFHLEPKSIIVFNLTVFCIISLYMLMGFFTPDGGLGLKNEWEMFVYAFVFGSQIGAVQSYTRTVFSDLTPAGREAEFFSLYEITDKGSSWLGPLVVGIIQTQTGEIRYAFIYITLVMLLPILGLIFLVDHKAGMMAAGRLSGEVDDGDARDAARHAEGKPQPGAAHDIELPGGAIGTTGNEQLPPVLDLQAS